MAIREERFLLLLKRFVYDHPSSPYLPLLRRSGCEYGDAVSGVRLLGLKGFLSRLMHEGIWISLEEFKGREAIKRNGVDYRVPASAFDNPSRLVGWEATTGGSTGRATYLRLNLPFLEERCCYEHFLLHMLDIRQAPLALWYPKLPSNAGISSCLRYAKTGKVPDRWLCMLSDRLFSRDFKSWATTEAIIRSSRFSRYPLPRPEPLDYDDVGPLLEWILDSLGERGRCVVQSYVSQIVRTCRFAEAGGVSLNGVQFIAGSEPLTPAKHREIERSGAGVFPRYMATEIGTIGIGCGRPAHVGEYHLVSDSVAAFQEGDGLDDLQRPLYYTSLLWSTPKIMVNVQLGDCGILTERACGCLLDELGFRTHMLHIRSLERTTGEGISYGFRALEKIVEEVLIPKYGGSFLDYQWVESEGPDACTRIHLIVDPAVGPVNECDMLNDILHAIEGKNRGSRLVTGIWRHARTLRILRRKPELTAQGKSVAVVRR